MVADFSLAQFKTKVGSVLGSIVDKKGSNNQKVIFKNCMSNARAHHQWNYTLVACFACGLGALA